MNALLAEKHARPCVYNLALTRFIKDSNCHCVTEEATHVRLGEATLCGDGRKSGGRTAGRDQLGDVELLHKMQ